MVKKKNTDESFFKYKNVLLIAVSLVLLIYAGYISIFPIFLTNSFNIDKFEEKVYNATSLLTTIDAIDFKITPGLNMIITIRNWSSMYVDEQDCFDAGTIQLTTNPMSIFTKNFKIKDLYLKNVKFSNQTLPDGENKLAFLPPAFNNSKSFGSKKITVVTGPVRVKNFKITNIAEGYYKQNRIREKVYSAQDVKAFLSGFYFDHVNIK